MSSWFRGDVAPRSISPAICPARMTTTRSQMPMISGRSDEMTRIAVPDLEQYVVVLPVYFVRLRIAGQGVYTRHLTKALVDLGHTVEVFGGQPYPVLDERIALHQLPSLDLWNDHFPGRFPGYWEMKTKADWAEAFSHSRHVRRTAGVQHARPAGAEAAPAATSIWFTTTSASATACSASRR